MSIALIKKRDLILVFLVEGLVLAVQLVFDHFHRVTYYVVILYLFPYLKIGVASAFRYELLALLYVINALKWLVLAWLFRKGWRASGVFIALLLIVLALLSFPFAELGF